MKTIRHIAAFLLALVPCCLCFGADDTNTVAVGAWSEATASSASGQAGSGAIRGRLLILEGHSSAYAGSLPETQVYVEIQNVSSGVGGPIEFYFDPREGLQTDVRDVQGNPPPPVGTGGDGAFPGPCWITLPYDSTVRLRSSWYGYGMLRSAGLKLPLFEPIILKANNTNDYYLAVTFTAPPATNHLVAAGHTVWQGTLSLPKVKVAGRRP